MDRLYRNTRKPDEMARQLTAALRPFDLPALIVWGARSVMKILPGSGHWPFADDPDSVAEAVLPFLRQQLQK